MFDCKLINIFDQKLADLGPGQYELKSFVDDWKTEHRMRQGKFGKVEQHPRKGTERILCSTLSQCPKEEVRKEYQASTLSKQIYMLCLVFVEILIKLLPSILKIIFTEEASGLIWGFI